MFLVQWSPVRQWQITYLCAMLPSGGLKAKSHPFSSSWNEDVKAEYCVMFQTNAWLISVTYPPCSFDLCEKEVVQSVSGNPIVDAAVKFNLKN